MLGSNESGAALVFAILIVVALLVLGSGMAILTRTDTDISRNQCQDVQALYVAEAGVEEALYRLSLPNPTNMYVNGSTINAAVADTSHPPDPNWRVRIFLAEPGSEPAAVGSDVHTVTLQPSYDWLEYSSASDPDLAITIEHKWKDLDDDGVREAGEIVLYDGSRYPPENFTSGTPVEVITVTGWRATAQRTILTEAVRFPLNPNVRAALMCDKGVDVRGNVTVCGHDHAFDTPHYTMLPNCRNWERCSNRTNCLATGCLTAVMTTGDEIDKRGSTDLAGEPAPEDTASSNEFYTLAEALGIDQAMVDAILANPDYTAAGQADPQDGITYIDNAASGEAKWNNGGGSGLIYVTGDFATAGNFTWRGLIYVEGDFKITGTPSIIGAVMVRGESDYAFSGGSPCILYSSEALSYYIGQYLNYIEIGWKEIAQR